MQVGSDSITPNGVLDGGKRWEEGVPGAAWRWRGRGETGAEEPQALAEAHRPRVWVGLASHCRSGYHERQPHRESRCPGWGLVELLRLEAVRRAVQRGSKVAPCEQAPVHRRVPLHQYTAA